MVRSIEDCKSGVDALKEEYTKLTKTNKSESVLDEWYTESFQDNDFLDYVPGKDLQLWIKKHKKTVMSSIKEALVEGLYFALTFTVVGFCNSPNQSHRPTYNDKHGKFHGFFFSFFSSRIW